MIPLLVAEPRERSVEALPLKRDHQDPFRARNHEHLVSGLNLQEFRTSLSRTTRYRSSTLNTAITHPTILTFLPRSNLSYRGQPGPYNQIGGWLTQKCTWSVGLSTLVISTIPGFSLSILAQCLPVSLALSVDDS